MKRAFVVVAIVISTAWTAPGQTLEGQKTYAFDDSTIRRIREVSPRLGKARDFVNRGELERARGELAVILASVPELSEAHFLMARVQYAAGEFPEALESMTRADRTFEGLRVLMPEMTEERRADLLKRRAELEVTINEVRHFPRLARNAALQTRLNRAEQARSNIDRELSSLNPGGLAKPGEYAFFQGNILLRLQRPSEAITQYRKALEADPGHAAAANNLAAVYYNGMEYEKALATLNGIEARGTTVNPELKRAIVEALRAK
jgi:tetratricopeptide (TPR) repeat protein